jgi:hypothetical protein
VLDMSAIILTVVDGFFHRQSLTQDYLS